MDTFEREERKRGKEVNDLKEQKRTTLNPTLSRDGTSQSKDARTGRGEAKTQVISWATAAPELKKDFPPPPRRDQFTSVEDFEEAKSSWDHFVGPVLARRHAI